VFEQMAPPPTLSDTLENPDACAAELARSRPAPIHDLAMLVDGSVEVGPPSGDLDVGFVDEPAVGGNVPTVSRCVDELRREGLHRLVDRHVINGDFAFESSSSTSR
jgi:hypothetical protein